ncbi:MAG: hypothetical protein JO342_06445 [Solirubrobacterales bacterium]|nr:hypothetical protein [Solirubrobacterales bacterium]
MTASRASRSEAGGTAAPLRRGNSRLIGRAVYVALVVATIAAFFISQHLKVTTPFISGVSGPYPPAINPVDGPTNCPVSSGGRHVSQRFTKVSFFLLHHVDNVDVYVVNQSGNAVRSLARGVFMAKKQARSFIWNGRDGAGGTVAKGSYFFQVHLIHQQRTIEIQQPVTVETATRCGWKG